MPHLASYSSLKLINTLSHRIFYHFYYFFPFTSFSIISHYCVHCFIAYFSQIDNTPSFTMYCKVYSLTTEQQWPICSTINHVVLSSLYLSLQTLWWFCCCICWTRGDTILLNYCPHSGYWYLFTSPANLVFLIWEMLPFPAICNSAQITESACWFLTHSRVQVVYLESI